MSTFAPPRPALRARWPVWLLALCLLAPGAASARAGDEVPAPAPGPEEERAAPEPTVAVIRGNRVNLRVGPRVDGRPVDKLDDGTVLLIVERVPEWVGVRVLRGFPAAVSARYVEAVGPDAVRVKAHELNVRVGPPVGEGRLAEAFRDHPAQGAVVPVLGREGDWVRIWAPESIRAYVSAQYVKELGPLSEHQAVVAAGRAERTAHLRALAQARREEAARRSGAMLREALGTAQQTLYKLRMRGGFDRTPVVRAINDLEAVLAKCAASPVAVRKLAQAIRQDLEAELEVRTARKDAEVARLRGLDPPAEKPPAPKIADVELRGEIRWEPAPRWRNGGAWVLWIEGDPRYVLHLSTGLPHPLPDLKGNAERGPRTVRGRQSGTRVFGLPVVEIRSIAK